MKVKVDKCRCGNDQYNFRLTLPQGQREFITCIEGENWSRKHSIEALDMLEANYHVNRRKVRFI